MKHPSAPLLALLVGLAASSGCSGDGSGGTTGADPVTSACHQAPLCDPIVLPKACTASFATITCGKETGGGGSGGEGGGGGLGEVQTARIQCALQALRDHAVGAVNLLVPSGSATCGTRIELVSFGDGSASVLPIAYCDLDVKVGTSARAELQPPAYFDACLGASGDAALLDCIAGMTTKKAVGGEGCTCRGIHDDPVRGLCRSD